MGSPTTGLVTAPRRSQDSLVPSNSSSSTALSSTNSVHDEKDQTLVNASSTSPSSTHSVDEEKATTLVDATSTSGNSTKCPSLEEEKPKTLVTITHALPPEKVDQRPFRQFRHVIFTVYRRLFTLVILGNIAALISIDMKRRSTKYYFKAISSAASANLFLTVAIRQDYIINFLFDVLAATPKSTPLRLRRTLTKIFEFGGVHSSAGMCATFWFIRLAIFLTISFANGELRSIPMLVLTYILLLLFIAIVVFAYPRMRSKYHNTFERIHRFNGWLCSAIFWTLIVLAADAMSTPDQSIGQILIHLPSFWLLSINTIHSVVPWLRLRKLEATPEHLSDHAIRIHLKANIGGFYTVRISDSPLTEWHSFACFIDRKPRNGSTNSVVISRAGDWTSKTIAEPKSHYYIRGLPTRGVLYMSLMFRSVVLVTTGSGIGPCLNLLSMERSTRPAVRCLWSTPKPLATFGEEIVEDVKIADPDAVIWDTRQWGRPDMVALTWQLLKESGAEAVFVVSNPKVTKMVVYAMESRGVAAFGPIFDS